MRKPINEILDSLEDTAIDVISVFGPWLGPVPSAYLVWRAVQLHLQWHWSVAVAAAIAVESIGVVSVVQALRLHEWNETRRKSDPTAPFGLAVTLVAFYFIITIGITVLLDVVPSLAYIAPAVFPLLAAVGAVNIAVKNGQRRREAARNKPVKSGKKPRKVSGNLPQPIGQDGGQVSPNITDWRVLKRSASREELQELAVMEVDKVMDKYQLENERTARNWRKNARKLFSENGIRG